MRNCCIAPLHHFYVLHVKEGSLWIATLLQPHNAADEEAASALLIKALPKPPLSIDGLHIGFVLLRQEDSAMD